MKQKIAAALTSLSMLVTAMVSVPAPLAQASDSDGTIKILPLGDSITDGYQSQGGYRKYLSRDLTELGYTNIDFVGPKGSDSETYDGFTYDGNYAGYSGYAIQEMTTKEHRSGILETISDTWYGDGSQNMIQAYDPDIVLLQIGTNDILSEYNDGITDRLENLINVILGDLSDGSVLFVTTIPDIDAVLRADWLSAYGINAWSSTDEEKAALQVTVQGCIDSYNASIKTLVEKMQAEGKSIKFADINSVIDYTTDLADGVHPNETGYSKMAEYWTGVLTSYINGSEQSGQTTTTQPATTTTTAATTTTTTSSSTTTKAPETTTTATETTPETTTTVTTVAQGEKQNICWEIEAPEAVNAGDTFTVTVKVSNPTGAETYQLTNAEFAFATDSEITLDSISSNSPAYNNAGLWLDTSTGKIYMNCSAIQADDDAVVLTAEFRVSDDAKAGTYTIALDTNSLSLKDESWSDISDKLECAAASVIVGADVDTNYNVADLVQLQNYLLGKITTMDTNPDMDASGSLDVVDLILLRQKLADK
jgi:lysophospholipase L1-like esterase